MIAEPRNLEFHRFEIHSTSLSYMKEMKIAYEQLRQKVPEVQGIGFFGSRTVGNETAKSDLDCVVYYDGSNFVLTTGPTTIVNGRMKFVIPEQKPEDLMKEAARQELIGKITALVTQSMKELGLPIDINSQDKNNSILLLDVSESSTRTEINQFIQLVNLKTEHFQKDLVIDAISGAQFNLVRRFFLAVGEGIYKNRAFILDYFSNLLNGERYFQILMDYLNFFERGATKKRNSLVPFHQYPQTIEEARKYFLTASV